MKLPEVTHTQYLVLGLLAGAQRSGQELRDAMAARGAKQSGPAFYQFMARLEDSGYVKGWYEQTVIDGQRVKLRKYKILGQGARAYEFTRNFYLRSNHALAFGG